MHRTRPKRHSTDISSAGRFSYRNLSNESGVGFTIRTETPPLVVTRQPGHTKVTLERHDGRNIKRKTLEDIGSAALDPLRDKLEEIMDGECPYDVGRAARDIAEMALVALNAPE